MPLISLFAIDKPVIDMSDADHVLHGKVVSKFEDEFAEYVGAKYAVGVCSCTMAIYLVLEYMKHAPLKVELPTMLPPVVANAVIHSGVQWQFVDNATWMGQHYTLASNDVFGRVVDSAQYVADSQHKYSSAYATLYSFYPTKPIGGIDGGMVVTDDRGLCEWLRLAINNGMTAGASSWERASRFPGWKAYMSTAQAMVARDAFHKWPERRKRIDEVAKAYDSQLSRANGRSHHLYQVFSEDEWELFESSEITVGLHYLCLHSQLCYQSYGAGSFPKSESIAQKIVSIPFHHQLTDEQVERVIKAVK